MFIDRRCVTVTKAPEGRHVYSTCNGTNLKAPAGRHVYSNADSQIHQAPVALNPDLIGAGRHVYRWATRTSDQSPRGAACV